MLVAVPVEAKAKESLVDGSFGRAPFFLLYNTESEREELVENPAVTNPGGAGVKAAQALVDKKANVLLTPRCGGNAAAVLHGAGISVFKSVPGTATENIALFKQGCLSALEEIHPGHHGAGG